MSSFLNSSKDMQESDSQDSGFYTPPEDDPAPAHKRAKRSAGTPGRPGTDAVDPGLPEKKRARRRLVGAVALVLAVVIGLPMILDSEPKPLADDIAIQIPSKDKPYQIGGLREAAASKVVSSVAASESLDQKEEIVDKAPVAVASAPVKPLFPVVSTKPAVTAAAVATVAAISSGHKHVDGIKPTNPQSVPAVEHKPEVKPPVKPEIRPKIKLEPTPEPKQEIKIESAIKNVPRPSAAAEAAAATADDAARARAILEGNLVPKPVAAKVASEHKPGRFLVQVAALATQDKIDELQNKLKEVGIVSHTQRIATASGDRTRIRVGPFADKDEAGKMRARLIKMGLNGTLVPL
jgi:DedD protein